MSDRSSLAICRDDGFIIKDTVPDISLCAQDLFASGVLLLCSILCCVAYTMHHIFNAASSRRRQVVSTREDAAERLLTREDLPDVKREGDEPGALEVPVIDIDPNDDSPNPKSSLRWQPMLLQGCCAALAVLYCAITVVGGLLYSQGRTHTQVREEASTLRRLLVAGTSSRFDRLCTSRLPTRLCALTEYD